MLICHAQLDLARCAMKAAQEGWRQLRRTRNTKNRAVL